MTPKELHNRMLGFGNNAITFSDRLPATYAAKHAGRQLVRAATSVGANYAEAQAAESKADFTHKLQIALKECRESHYWLDLLSIRQIGHRPLLTELLDEASQLCAILSKATSTAKSRP